jgi:hypothetical protein
VEIDRLEHRRLDRIVGVDDDTSVPAGRPASAAGSLDQLTATSTMSARAACSRVPALIEGPSAPTSVCKESGPRLFEIVASMPARASVRANAVPMAPDPMMPMVM